MNEMAVMELKKSPKHPSLKEATLKSNKCILRAFKNKDYETVCLHVGKYLEKLLSRIDGTSMGRQTFSNRLDTALSRKEMKPILYHNLKAAWELRNLAAHNIGWEFRKEHAVTASIAFNGLIRWFFGPYQTQRLIKDLNNTPAKKLKASEPNSRFTLNRDALEADDIVDRATAQQYFKDWFNGRTELNQFVSCSVNLLKTKGLLTQEDDTVGAYQLAADELLGEKGVKPAESILFRSISIYFIYNNRNIPRNRPISPPELEDLLWFLSLDTGILLDDFKSLLDQPDRAFIQRVTINV